MKINYDPAKLHKIRIYNNVLALYQYESGQYNLDTPDMILHFTNFYLETACLDSNHNEAKLPKHTRNEKIFNRKGNRRSSERYNHVALLLKNDDIQISLSFNINQKSKYKRFRTQFVKHCVLKSLLDDYRMEELLGNGSSGFVYSVCHKKTSKKFAAKIFKTKNLADQRSIEYLLNEIKVMRKMDHPG